MPREQIHSRGESAWYPEGHGFVAAISTKRSRLARSRVQHHRGLELTARHPWRAGHASAPPEPHLREEQMASAVLRRTRDRGHPGVHRSPKVPDPGTPMLRTVNSLSMSFIDAPRAEPDNRQRAGRELARRSPPGSRMNQVRGETWRLFPYYRRFKMTGRAMMGGGSSTLPTKRISMPPNSSPSM